MGPPCTGIGLLWNPSFGKIDNNNNNNNNNNVIGAEYVLLILLLRKQLNIIAVSVVRFEFKHKHDDHYS